MKLFLTLLLSATLMVSGCSLTTPKDTGREHMQVLDPLASPPKFKQKYGALVINYPQAPNDLDTFRVALTDVTDTRDYFAGTRWAEFLPGQVQSTLVNSFARSGLFASVREDDTAVAAQYQLTIEILHFEAVYDRPGLPPFVHITAAFELLDVNRQRAVKRFMLESQLPADANTTLAISAAFRGAFANIQADALNTLGGR